MSMNILILDDEPGIRAGLSNFLKHYKYYVFEASTLKEGWAVINNNDIDCVLLDLHLEEENGLLFLQEMGEKDVHTSVIVITGYGGIQNAVQCMKNGASNYITKPIDDELLLSILEREEQFKHAEKEKEAYRIQLDEYQYKDVVLQDSNHPGIIKIMNKIEKVKDSPVPVLIMGETGTGKEVTAKYIHNTSVRKQEPFVSMNCASINDNLLESELFGHERGAFTGASHMKPGRFEIAGNGTLFLDEIGDMSFNMQAKLLRILQEGTYERVGGVKTLNTYCRIIAATNKDLPDLILKNQFREDLYYRLNVVEIKLPPLRERRQDISKFVNMFIKQANTVNNKTVTSIHPELIAKLVNYDWPGNIRQLKNIVSNAVLLADSDTITRLDSFDGKAADELALLDNNLKETIAKKTRQYEAGLITHYLVMNNNNITRTAKALGISRKTLYDKIEQYNIAVT